jgi:hypothetical protein
MNFMTNGTQFGIYRASTQEFAYSTTRERGRSHYNKKMLFAKQRCSPLQ